MNACAYAHVKSFSFYIHYVHFVTTSCISEGCGVNIAVNIVNIEKRDSPSQPSPEGKVEGIPPLTPPPKRGRSHPEKAAE